VIADGVVAMEGNGPLNGTARSLGKIVLADDPVAADATCARLMGLEPNRIVHIQEGAKFLGNASNAVIDQSEKRTSPPRLLSMWFPNFDIFMHCDVRCLAYYNQSRRMPVGLSNFTGSLVVSLPWVVHDYSFFW
jgi:Domain of unknown function (DUF362)